jgi:hypothetical protein
MDNLHLENRSVAVTGHRHIPDDSRLEKSIRQILETLIKKDINYRFLLYSALAEGSDQLIARIALKYQQFELHVPLPMDPKIYLQDFYSEKGKSVFRELSAAAAKVFILSTKGDHQEPYLNLAYYLATHADILIALWNGVTNHGVGGTSDVIRISSDLQKPIYWIYCPNQKTGEVNLAVRNKQIGDIEILTP